MLRFLIAAVAVACVAWQAQAQTPPPAEAFGRLPAIDDAAISPDGSKVALAVNGDGGPTIVVVDLTSHQRIFSARAPDGQQLRSVGWGDDTHVSFLISRAMEPGDALPPGWYFQGSPHEVVFYRTGVINLSTQHTQLMSASANMGLDQGSTFISPIVGDNGNGRLIGPSSIDSGAFLTVYKINLDSGSPRDMLPSGRNNNTIGYLVDGHGNIVTRTDVDNRNNRWSIFAYNNGAPHLLMSDVSDTGAPDFEPQGMLSDGRLAATAEDSQKEFYQLYAINLANGEHEPVVTIHNQDITDVITDPWDRLVVGVEWVEDQTKQRFFDTDLQAAYVQLSTQFAGAARIVSWSRDHSRLLVYAQRGLDGGGYYVFTPSNNQANLLGYVYPELAAANETAAREALTYRARDGTRIPAYLTLPSPDARNAPLVVLVHGGPSARDTLDFDWWAAFLASRGYAVLQPNYRGSGGYGHTWETAGWGQWGGLMQTDVEDGIAPLAHAGLIDPARVCIIGASYGGYAALAGATLTPDRYKCAVSVAGLSDLSDFLRVRQAQTNANSMTSDYWRKSIGDRHDDGAHLREVSPANLADHVQIPILLMHGTHDSVVPIGQTRLMRDRLNAAHKSVRYVELPNEDHWLSVASTRTQMLHEIDVFLAQNLPVTPAH